MTETRTPGGTKPNPHRGKRVYIDPTAEISPDANIGDGVSIWNWSKVREGARIGDGTNIGQGVHIDKDVIVGRECKIQNGVSLYVGVSLGDRVFVGPSAVFTNDLLPRAHGDAWKIVPTNVENGASIGANATIICGVTLGEYCMVGAGAVVTRDVPAHALVMGNPARIADYVTVKGRRLRHPLDGPPPSKEILEKD